MTMKVKTWPTHCIFESEDFSSLAIGKKKIRSWTDAEPVKLTSVDPDIPEGETDHIREEWRRVEV